MKQMDIELSCWYFVTNERPDYAFNPREHFYTKFFIYGENNVSHWRWWIDDKGYITSYLRALLHQLYNQR